MLFRHPRDRVPSGLTLSLPGSSNAMCLREPLPSAIPRIRPSLGPASPRGGPRHRPGMNTELQRMILARLEGETRVSRSARTSSSISTDNAVQYLSLESYSDVGGALVLAHSSSRNALGTSWMLCSNSCSTTHPVTRVCRPVLAGCRRLVIRQCRS